MANELYRCDPDPAGGWDVIRRATPEEIAAACPEVEDLREQLAELRRLAEGMADHIQRSAVCPFMLAACPCRCGWPCPVRAYRLAHPKPQESP